MPAFGQNHVSSVLHKQLKLLGIQFDGLTHALQLHIPRLWDLVQITLRLYTSHVRVSVPLVRSLVGIVFSSDSINPQERKFVTHKKTKG